jgi:hypothetical protein
VTEAERSDLENTLIELDEVTAEARIIAGRMGNVEGDYMLAAYEELRRSIKRFIGE